VVEFAWDRAWDRIDAATAGWTLAHLPDVSSSGHPSWLERCCCGPAGGDAGGDRPPAGANVAGWAREHGFHGTTEADELAAIGTG